jgi:Ca2+-binding RTX toxin-like protein
MLGEGQRDMKGRALLVLVMVVAALTLSSGVALAATITCQAGVDCVGTLGADTLEGTAGNDHIYGGGGGDTLKGFNAFDELYGQRGSDRLFGGPTKDGLYGGPGNDELNGGADYDAYRFHTNSWGKDTISDNTSAGSTLFFGVAGDEEVTDELSITLYPGTGPEVKNAGGTSTIDWGSDTLIKNVYSGNGDDTITGNLLNNAITGGKGTDTISSGPGNDDIDVADGEVDYVNCGSGLFGSQDYDYVTHDPFDVISATCADQFKWVRR